MTNTVESSHHRNINTRSMSPRHSQCRALGLTTIGRRIQGSRTMQSTLTIVLLSLFYVTLGEEKKFNLPSYIKRCDIDEDNLAGCIREQIVASLPYFTKGVPELGVPSIDPIQLDDIKIDGSGLSLKFYEAAMHGLSSAELMDFKLNVGEENEQFSMAFKCNLSLTAQYEVDGRILILPIQGKGDASVFAEGVSVQIDSKLIHVKKNNEEHFKLTTPTYKYDVVKTTFDLKNLFNGNKQLSDTTLAFANQNWRQLMDELAPPSIKQIVITGVKAINKFFSKVPINQMIIGYKSAN